ncbi:MAG: Wzz/FepE/Etk N-terminal domain-containing protein, partial [bacterium]|nr:Wzz/FepE/Etk N-terminal domain-containing protein [bacterium]
MKTTDTNQYELDLRDYYVILLKRRRLILVTALAVGLLSFVSAFLKQSTYESVAAVKVEQSKTMSGLFLEAFSWNAWDNIASESEVIRSTPVLAKVAQSLGLIPGDLSFEEIRESEVYSAVVQDLQGKIRTEQEGSTNIINILVASSHPQESKKIANAVAAEYRSYHVFSRTNEARRTREFIEQQLVDTQSKLEISEGRLRAFKEAKNFITLDAEMALTLNRLQVLQTEYEQVKRRSRETAMMIERLRQKTIAGLDQALAERPYIESEKTILFQLNSNLVELILSRNNLLIDYTIEHPQVKAIDEKIADVKREMLKELQSEQAVYQQREEVLDGQISEILDRNENLPEYEL